MKKILPLFLLTLLPVAASGDQGMPEIFSQLKPAVGAWGEYSFESKKGDKTTSKSLFRLAVVGKQGDSLWVEQKITPEFPKPKREGRQVALKILMGKNGIEKSYMKTERGVLDMSSMMKTGAHKAGGAVNAKMTKVGDEKIEVPAGKFTATHYTFSSEKGGGTGDTWLKPGVGPYGMVKQLYHDKKDGAVIMLLTASGDGAKSEIDESTAKSPMAGGMAEMMKDRQQEAGSEDHAAKESAQPAPKMPSLGGLFKSALKKKAGLSDD